MHVIVVWVLLVIPQHDKFYLHKQECEADKLVALAEHKTAMCYPILVNANKVT